MFGTLIGTRHRVVHERARQELTRFVVVDAVLEQRLTDALNDPAMQLTLDDHRIDDAADVVDRNVGQKVDDAGAGIDLDLGDMRAARDR